MPLIGKNHGKYRQVRKLLSIRLTKLQPGITLSQAKDYIRRTFLKHNIIPISTRVLIHCKVGSGQIDNYKATIYKYRVAKGVRQYFVHFDGHKAEIKSWIPENEIRGHLKEVMDQEEEDEEEDEEEEEEDMESKAFQEIHKVVKLWEVVSKGLLKNVEEMKGDNSLGRQVFNCSKKYITKGRGN